jgi:hypothetical protein
VPRSGDDPLSYYLGARPLHLGGPSSVRTDAIPVLSTNYQVRKPPGPFRLVNQQRLAPIFFLWPYEADHPVRVRLGELKGDRVLSERSAVLLRTSR